MLQSFCDNRAKTAQNAGKQWEMQEFCSSTRMIQQNQNKSASGFNASFGKLSACFAMYRFCQKGIVQGIYLCFAYCSDIN